MANRGGWTLPPQDDGPDEEQMAQLAPRLRLRLPAACKARDFEHNTPTPGERLRTQACGAESLAKPTSTLSYRALSAKATRKANLKRGCLLGRIAAAGGAGNIGRPMRNLSLVCKANWNNMTRTQGHNSSTRS